MITTIKHKHKIIHKGHQRASRYAGRFKGRVENVNLSNLINAMKGGPNVSS